MNWKRASPCWNASKRNVVTRSLAAERSRPWQGCAIPMRRRARRRRKEVNPKSEDRNPKETRRPKSETKSMLDDFGFGSRLQNSRIAAKKRKRRKEIDQLP